MTSGWSSDTIQNAACPLPVIPLCNKMLTRCSILILPYTFPLSLPSISVQSDTQWLLMPDPTCFYFTHFPPSSLHRFHGILRYAFLCGLPAISSSPHSPLSRYGFSPFSSVWTLFTFLNLQLSTVSSTVRPLLILHPETLIRKLKSRERDL